MLTSLWLRSWLLLEPVIATYTLMREVAIDNRRLTILLMQLMVRFSDTYTHLYAENESFSLLSFVAARRRA